MSYKDISAGDKVARAVGARFIKAGTGTVGLEVAFDFEENGNIERLMWVAWLSEKALQNSMKTLVDVLGFNGNDQCDDNGILMDPVALDYKKQVKLVVDFEEGKDKQGNPTGKSYPRIKWVNNLGGSSFSGCTPESIKNDLGALGFKAAFLAAKQNGPMTAAPSHLEPLKSPTDLPF